MICYRFKMFFKLSIAMGLGWTFEIIAWVIVESKATVPIQFTFIMLIIIECQGIVVFIVFGLKGSNRRMMKSKLSQLFATQHTVTERIELKSELTSLN